MEKAGKKSGIEPTEEFKREFSGKKKESTAEWCGRIIKEIVQFECFRIEKENKK